jgi:hypothetical protein
MIEAINAGEWKVRIDKPVCVDRIDFYIYRYRNGYSQVIQSDGLVVNVKEGEYLAAIRPSLSLSGVDGKQMLHALADALAEEGIKTQNDHALRGQLEAQTAHLQDMRTLLKLNKTSGVSK